MSDSSAGTDPVIVCFKWGDGYPGRYANILYRALDDRLQRPFRFVCLTDDPVGLDPGIEPVALPDFAIDRAHWVPGMWPKLAAFKPGLFADGTPVLLLDVDVLIMRDLGPLVDRIRETGAVHTIQDWPGLIERGGDRYGVNRRGSNSSVVGFVAGTEDATRVWEAFHDRPFAELARIARNDQEFLDAVCHDRRFWPADWVASFKKTLCKVRLRTLFGIVDQPSRAFIVAFHGKPNPEDLVQPRFRRWGSNEIFGFFPVSWVREYWQKYAEPGPEGR